MEKIILKAQNEEELKNMISRSLTLKEDETYQVKVLKYPKKVFLFSALECLTPKLNIIQQAVALAPG